MNDEENKCIICDEKFLESDEKADVGRKGLDTLSKCSEQRNDGKRQVWARMQKWMIHVSCRKSYTRQIPKKSELPPESVTRRSQVTKFNYHTQCLFCEQETDVPNPKSSKNQKVSIHRVETKTFSINLRDFCRQRNDEWSNNVFNRINQVDLIAAEARYHRHCYQTFYNHAKNEKRGRPVDPKLLPAMSALFDYLDENDECQYSLQELQCIIRNIAGEDICSAPTLKTYILNHYKNSVICRESPGKSTVFSFLGKPIATRKVFTDDEKFDILEKAANIIRDDICQIIFDGSVYPTLNDMKENENLDFVPHSLQTFMKSLLFGEKFENFPHPDSKIRKVTIISHAIIAACRPRSFISPLQLGLSVYLEHRYGSKHLISLLHSLGLCSSYEESIRYMNCAADYATPGVNNGFFQFVFDNADFNIRTLDGLGTFHALGGVKCVTPAEAVEIPAAIPRVLHKKIDTLSNKIPILTYKKPGTGGLACVLIKNLTCSRNEVAAMRNSFQLDVSWMIAFNNSALGKPSWNGFMSEGMKKTGTFHTSKILPTPFLNLNPSNPTTLYSALNFAADQCRAQNQPCIVTFDQPLFIKSSEIVAAESKDSPLAEVIVRLGGFHLLMSYLGSIGTIMKGSGLEELWECCYAKNTIVHLLSGHAFSRSVRAHILTQAAIFNVIVKEFPKLKKQLTPDILQIADDFFQRLLSANDIYDSEVLMKFTEGFEAICNTAKERSRTSKLWLQYFDQVALMLQFIKAERSADWQLHIATVVKMLPHFHAAGHVLYAKSAHLYAQQMRELELRLSPSDFEKFTNGYFTIRRTKKFWTGTWSDMIIEQSLMKDMKSCGGLTRGRGITESNLLRWILFAPTGTEVSRSIQEFSGVSSYSTEQHVELRPSRQSRDRKDEKSFETWLLQHNPFRNTSGCLISLSTGVVADSSVNCDSAVEKGNQSMSALEGKDFGTVTIHRKDKVTSLASMNNAIKVRDNDVIINPQQLFNRIVCVHKNKKELKDYFRFELAAKPLSLFDEISMRKGTKSSLVKAFSVDNFPSSLENIVYVLDGGNLLHSVVWPKPAKYGDILDVYVSYVKTHYGDGKCYIVFDGYPDTPTTKNVEQNRRMIARLSADIEFDIQRIVTVRQADFLNNPHNKTGLIKALMTRLQGCGISVSQAEDDADVDIVNTALKNSYKDATVVVVGKDTDLLVLLTSLAKPNNKIWYLKPGTKAQAFFIPNQKKYLSSVCDILLLIHAMSGCDTTSAFFRQGKLKLMKKFEKDPNLRSNAAVFYKADASKDEISENGEKIILSLYNAKLTPTLDEYRYYYYNCLTAKNQLSSNFNLASLPPTSAAAKQHSFRVYVQVQKWLGRNINPTDWGWILTADSLTPKTTELEPAPPELLNLVSCGCKISCGKHCDCVRGGLDCSPMCANCQGRSCTNSFLSEDESETED